MSNPIVGKWQEVSEDGLSALFQAIGLPDPAPDSEASFEFKVDDNGVYTEIFDTGNSVTTRSYTSGEEVDGITTVVEDNVITEVDTLDEGKVLNVKRVFSENEMHTTLSSPSAPGLEAKQTFNRV